MNNENNVVFVHLDLSKISRFFREAFTEKTMLSLLYFLAQLSSKHQLTECVGLLLDSIPLVYFSVFIQIKWYAVFNCCGFGTYFIF